MILNSTKDNQPTERPKISVQKPYRGRFAPSPSGLLHFGSLIAALASYLDAKSTIDASGKPGTWLVRIEDIDPPREQIGASDAILKTLEAYGLFWDEDILYQSKQSHAYRDLLDQLTPDLSYYCQCSRASIKAIGGIYQGHCKTLHHPKENSAIRLINQQGIYQFNDIFQGNVIGDKALAEEDFIIHRKDGLFAYQLAVVHDDIYQGITHVIRGCDLLAPTTRQLSLFATLKSPAPRYGHVPLAVNAKGFKLSKQNKAPAIDTKQPQPTLYAALNFLGQQPPLALIHQKVEEMITWAVANWSRDKVPHYKEVIFNPKSIKQWT